MLAVGVVTAVMICLMATDVGLLQRNMIVKIFINCYCILVCKPVVIMCVYELKLHVVV